MNKKWWMDEVIYQIYPKSFKDTNNDGIGDIKGIIEKLDYLQDLGITMIWLCPIFKSPMVDNGYDVSDYFTINEEFGSNEDFELLIKEAKKKGIKIMLDLVLNHTSNQHEWFKDALENEDSPYRDYYIFKKSKDIPNNWRSVFGGSVWEKVPGRDEYYFHCFAKQQPDLNWENPKLRQEMYKIVNYWIDKGIYSFRLDAINHLKKDQSFKSLKADGVDGLVSCTKTARNQEGLDFFLEELKENTFSRKDCMTVGETAGLNYNQLASYIGEDGHFSLIFDFKPADFDIESGNEWFKRLDWEVKDYYDISMTSQENIQKYGFYANFIENHDQPRATTKILRSYHENKEAVKMLAAYYYFQRGVNFIYQGQELGMTNFNRDSIDEFDDISSIDQYHRSIEEGFSEKQALNIVNLRSRDNARIPFLWDGSKYFGFSDAKPWLKVSEENKDRNAQSQKSEDSIFEFYKKIIAFKKDRKYKEILTYGKIRSLSCEDNILSYKRYYNSEEIICLFNFNDTKKDIKIDKSYELIFTSQKEFNKDKLNPFQAVLFYKEG